MYERAQAIASDLDITLEDLPGMCSLRNVERNCAVADGRGLPPEQLEALRTHRWERDFYS